MVDVTYSFLAEIRFLDFRFPTILLVGRYLGTLSQKKSGY